MATLMPAIVTVDMKMTSEQFDYLSRMIHTQFGIELPPSKRSLLESRLRKMVAASGISNFNDFYETHLRTPSRETLSKLIDRVSTNHTFFYREPQHFDFFAKVALPEAMARHQRDKDLRIWCAASSSGEEPYTLAMVILEHLGMARSEWKHSLLATDISDHALSKARAGVYDKTNISNLPRPWQNRYLQALPDQRFAVKDTVKNAVIYRRFNLMNTSLPFRSALDAVFCRNVMIYFDEPTKLALVDRIYDRLAEGGYLFIGHSESLPRDRIRFRYVRPGVYQRASS